MFRFFFSIAISASLLICLGACGSHGDSTNRELSDSLNTKNVNTIKMSDKTETNDTNQMVFVTMANIDVMFKDMGLMSAPQATALCAKIGNGWRLPNSEELNMMYAQGDNVKNLDYTYYWGQDIDSEVEADGSVAKSFVRQSLVNGERVYMQSNEEINSVYGVRLVRDHH